MDAHSSKGVVDGSAVDSSRVKSLDEEGDTVRFISYRVGEPVFSCN